MKHHLTTFKRCNSEKAKNVNYDMRLAVIISLTNICYSCSAVDRRVNNLLNDLRSSLGKISRSLCAVQILWFEDERVDRAILRILGEQVCHDNDEEQDERVRVHHARRDLQTVALVTRN